MTTEVAEPTVTVIEAVDPFQIDDGHKGTFLVLRIAGLEQGTALKVINRKYRSWQNWRALDPDFRRLDDQISPLAQKFGGEARVLRTALLDISIVEAGIGIFRKILTKQPMSDGMWAYAVKMAGLRMPMMGAEKEIGNPWERLANAIKSTIVQKELTVSQAPNGTKSVTAKETILEPSTEQRQMTSDIIQNAIQQAEAS